MSMANKDPWQPSAGGRITDSRGLSVKWLETERIGRNPYSTENIEKRQSIHLFVRLFGKRHDEERAAC
jgi:hypothetical protein